MDRKVILFAKCVAEATACLGKYFKLNEKNVWKMLNTRDPRFDDEKTPLEVLYENSERGLRKVKNFISSHRAGDYA